MSTMLSAASSVRVYGHTQTNTSGFRAYLSQMWRALSLRYAIYCERRQMRALDDEALRDMGISRAALEKECARKFVDVEGCER